MRSRPRAQLVASTSYIVRLDGSVAPGQAAASGARDHGVTKGFVYRRVFPGFNFRGSSRAAAAIAKRRGVLSVTPDQVVTMSPVDCSKKPNHPSCGGGSPTGQPVPWGVAQVGGPLDGTGRTAWVIDTGIDLNHPDLNVDVERSECFIDQGQSCSPDDFNGHGTHVAGIIAAKNNSIGVVGVAADATVVSVRVLDSNGSGTVSSVIAGLDFVANHASTGDVVNLSLGGPEDDNLDDAVRAVADRGVRVSIAAGNDSYYAEYHSPARVNYSGVYTISAIDVDGCFASFSSFGNPPVDYAAPGVDILSTYAGGGYASLDGTSMAAPHVAGILLFGAPCHSGKVADCQDGGDPDGKPDKIVHVCP